MNGLAEIEINGEKVGLKYGLPALQLIYEKLDKVTFLASETYTVLSVVQIIYAGYANYCLVKELIPKFSFEDIFEWVEDNMNSGELIKAVNAFNESKYIKKKVEDVEPEEKKSPSVGKKLKKQHSVNLA